MAQPSHVIKRYDAAAGGGAYIEIDPPTPFQVVNSSIGAQVVVAATRTYIAGSEIRIPASRRLGNAGVIFRWKFSMTKTAAGVATSTIDICVGTAGTTADTARVAFTKPAGTAAADEALVSVVGVLRAADVIAGQMTLIHNLASTGHAQIPCVVVNTTSASFDMSGDGLVVGLCLTSGASDAITIEMVEAECTNLAPSTSP